MYVRTYCWCSVRAIALACALTCPRLRWRPPGREPHTLRGGGDWQGCRTVEGQPGPTPAGSEQKPSPYPVARAQLEGQRVPSQSSGCLHEYPAVTLVEWEAQFSESFPWHALGIRQSFCYNCYHLDTFVDVIVFKYYVKVWVQSYVCIYVPLRILSNALIKSVPTFCHLQRQFDIQTPPHCLSHSNLTIATNIQQHKTLAPLGDKLLKRIQWPTAAEAHTFDTIALLSTLLYVAAASKSVSRLVPTDSGRRFWAMKPLPSVRDAHTEHELAKQWKRVLLKKCDCPMYTWGRFCMNSFDLNGTMVMPWLYWVLGTACIYTYVCTGIRTSE